MKTATRKTSTKTVWYVKAFSMDRARRQVDEPRYERIDTATNEIFKGCKTAAQVEAAYEAFWNNLNPNPAHTVKVMDIVHRKAPYGAMVKDRR